MTSKQQDSLKAVIDDIQTEIKKAKELNERFSMENNALDSEYWYSRMLGYVECIAIIRRQFNYYK